MRQEQDFSTELSTCSLYRIYVHNLNSLPIQKQACRSQKHLHGKNLLLFISVWMKTKKKKKINKTNNRKLNYVIILQKLMNLSYPLFRLEIISNLLKLIK